jgi:hypothetical protein
VSENGTPKGQFPDTKCWFEQLSILYQQNHHHCNKHDWLVVLTILKNISQWEGLSHILWKINNVPNHQPDDFPLRGGYTSNFQTPQNTTTRLSAPKAAGTLRQFHIVIENQQFL